MLYFPYNAQDLAKVSFEDFSMPMFESLERVPDILKESNRPQIAPVEGDEKSS